METNKVRGNFRPMQDLEKESPQPPRCTAAALAGLCTVTDPGRTGSN